MTESVRIRDIAEACGVSVSAVSRALKGQPGLHEDTRLRITSVAQQQGYDLSRLRTGKIKRALLLFHRQHSISQALPFYSQLLLGIKDNCRDHGITLSFLSIGPGDAASGQVLLHQPDALICAGFFEPELLGLLQQTRLSLVLVNLWAPGLPCVNPDDTQSGYPATQHLIAQGRSRIVFLTSTLAHYNIRQREKGYRQALYKVHLLMPPEYEAIAPPLLDTEQSLVGAVNELLSLLEPPNAILAYNDVAALVVQRVCAQQGIRIPEDLALVGFDDIDAAAWSHPPLATIAANKQQLGREALRLLLEENQEENLLLPVQLVVCGSSGK